MRKTIPVMLLALLFGMTAAAVWAAGSSEATSGGQAAPLTVWMKKGFVEEQNTAFEARAQEFAKANNLVVNVELLAYEDIFPKWTAAIESKNVPDVSFFGYQEVGQFAGQGVLADVTDLLKQIEGKNGKLFPASVDAVTFGGKTFAIPFWGEGTALYYRTDLFQQAGISGPPKTWAEFRDDSKKLTDVSKGIYGAGLGYGDGNSDCEWLSRAMIWSFGGSIFGPDGKSIVFDSPGTKAAIDYVVGLFQQDKVTAPGALGWNDGGNNTAYISGQAAMVVNTGSIIAALKKNNPELLAKTGVVPLPSGPSGQFTAGISNNLGIFKDARNPKSAREFLSYVLDPKWYQQWIDVSAPLALPVYQELAKSDPVWQQPHNKGFMDSMATFKFLGYKGPYTPAAGKIYNLRLINSLFENILSKGMSRDAAIAEFTSAAQQAVNQ
jgi:multiple sugar transport system substrate-binding protein